MEGWREGGSLRVCDHHRCCDSHSGRGGPVCMFRLAAIGHAAVTSGYPTPQDAECPGVSTSTITRTPRSFAYETSPGEGTPVHQ